MAKDYLGTVNTKKVMKDRTKGRNPKADSSGPILDEDEIFSQLVSIGNLRKTWNQVRKEIRNLRIRDSIDWVDWAVSIESTLTHLRDELLSGEYTPLPPTRYELGKARGAFRVMTVPNIRDVLVYRLICNAALELAIPTKVPGAFFSRRHEVTPVGDTFDLKDDPYLRFFEVWLRYHQYRTRTMLNEPYEVLVVSDITNYFDSISHRLLLEYLSPLGLPRKAVGLLGRILETLKPSAGHSANPGIGIPVDECDCSRELAHIFLFEHDKRMVKEFGETNYVRWMDDQNIGACSFTEARRIVNVLNRSLSCQRLTINSGKTKFLTPVEVLEHFQLDANEELDKWNEKYKRISKRRINAAKKDLANLWQTICNGPMCGKGNWDKVLKRFYAYCAKVGSDLLDERIYDDLIDFPHLDERIFMSLARRNKGATLVNLFKKYCRNGESLFESTEAAFFDACLLLEATNKVELAIRELAYDFAEGKVKRQSKKPFGKSGAVLCLYWFNYPKTELVNLFSSNDAPVLPAVVARTWLAIVAARIPESLTEIQKKLVGHPSDDVARLCRFLNELVSGDIEHFGNYKRQKYRWPRSGKFYDPRAWLQLELLSVARSKKLRQLAKSDMRAFRKLARSRQDKRVFRRIQFRLK